MGDEGPDFYALMLRRETPAYAAFDLLWLNGRDLRAQPLWRRKMALKKSSKAHRSGTSIMWPTQHSSHSPRNGISKASSRNAGAIVRTGDGMGEGETRRVLTERRPVGTLRSQAAVIRRVGKRPATTLLLHDELDDHRLPVGGERRRDGTLRRGMVRVCDRVPGNAAVKRATRSRQFGSAPTRSAAVSAGSYEVRPSAHASLTSAGR